MARICPRCHQSRSAWSFLLSGSDLCEPCEIEAGRAMAAEAMARLETRQREEIEALESRLAQASQIEITPDELRQLEFKGFLIVAGKLVRCPLCDHPRFGQGKALLNSRGATFLGFDWANEAAKTRVCQGCGHILWFA